MGGAQHYVLRTTHKGIYMHYSLLLSFLLTVSSPCFSFCPAILADLVTGEDDDCCDDEEDGEVDEDIIIDEEESNDDEGVNT